MRRVLPWTLVLVHTGLIVLFMLMWRRWPRNDIVEFFYMPFFVISGPVVYLIAHAIQDWSIGLFPSGSLAVWPLDVVPGVACLILGAIQWWWIGRFLVWLRERWLQRGVADTPQ